METDTGVGQEAWQLASLSSAAVNNKRLVSSKDWYLRLSSDLHTHTMAQVHPHTYITDTHKHTHKERHTQRLTCTHIKTNKQMNR